MKFPSLPEGRGRSFLYGHQKNGSRDVLDGYVLAGRAAGERTKKLRTTLHYIRKAFNGESVFESRRDVLALGGDLEIETRYEGGDMFKDLFIEGCPGIQQPSFTITRAVLNWRITMG